MPNRREPITSDMIEFILAKAKTTHEDSLVAALADWFVLGEYTGARLSEWAQTLAHTQRGQIGCNNIDNSSKAFILEDFQFEGSRCKRLCNAPNHTLNPHEVHGVRICWCYQKNGDNGQKILYTRNTANTTCCAVRAALSIRKRAQRLKIKSGNPLAMYRDKKGQVSYIHNKDIDDTLRSTAKTVYNISKEEELSRWSAHSIRVGAAVTMHIAGANAEEIKICLRWRSNTFMFYLRDVPALASKHNHIIHQANADDS